METKANYLELCKIISLFYGADTGKADTLKTRIKSEDYCEGLYEVRTSEGRGERRLEIGLGDWAYMSKEPIVKAVDEVQEVEKIDYLELCKKIDLFFGKDVTRAARLKFKISSKPCTLDGYEVTYKMKGAKILAMEIRQGKAEAITALLVVVGSNQIVSLLALNLYIDSLDIDGSSKHTIKHECIKQSNKKDAYFTIIDHLVYIEVICNTGFSCSFAASKEVI